ncbi:SDR family NAD(P)-dependent oxidoreductase, partial [Streptomyces europaeiscabiei]
AVPRTPLEAALPTYAFDRERYWLPAPDTVPADPSAWGADGLDHPWLTLSTPLADDGLILTGRIDTTGPGQRWLSDHKVFDTVLLPGTAILDMVLTAAARVGATGIDTLTLTTPLVLPDSGPLRIQVAVTGIDGNGQRQVTVHTHPGPDTHPGTPWTTHATAQLTHHTPAHTPDPVDWTATEQAERVPLDGFYDRFRDRGIDYGPAFQGLVELSRTDDTAYAVIRLPEAEAVSAQAGDFALHPALLDAALHAVAVLDDDTAGVSLPFEWTGVELYATGATELRVRIQRDPASSQARLWMADAHGAPVAYVDALVLRSATEQQLRRRTGSHLYRLDFQPPRTMREAPAETWVLGGSGELAHVIGGRPVVDVDELRARLDAGDEPPARLVLDSTTPAPGDLADAARAAIATALHVTQELLAESRLEGTELVWVTREAVPAEPGMGVDGLVHAPLWGLVRAARAEYPQRSLRLVDTGPAAEDAAALARAVSVTDEPEIAVRGGEIRVARLVAVELEQKDVPEGTPASEGTALITGGTGELGRELARHLVRTRGVRRLVLTSRQGEGAPGAADLAAELTGAGADSVRIVACDVADREGLAGLIGSIDDLDSVWHLAGVLDDGLLPDQNTERLERVLAPKLDAALHLHELTREHELSEFVMFSSLAGVLGSAGQSTYAAGNAFLDAFAAWRAHAGLPARSLSWGLWEQGGTGLTAHLGRAELTRIRRMGVEPLSVDEGLRTLDAALATDAREHLVPVRLGPASAHRDQDEVPVLLRGLLRTRLRRANTGETPSGPRGRLAALSPDQRRESLTLLVRSAAASVLGLPDEGAVSAQQVLRDLGLDSLMAVELRRRISRETEVSLPATLAFDHPTPAAMAEYLLERMDLSPAVLPAKAVARAADGDDDPVAIVSMACRLPGGVGTPEEFWELLSSGGDAIEEFPSRWDGWDVYDPDPEAVGKTYAREGGFLRDVEGFDAGFFGIPPREARAMDPQQRLVLEASWEALERAGIRPETMEGSNTGVYLGAMGSDYDRFRNQDLNALDAYGSMGSAGSVLSGRVSYSLGLRGPAVTVDTACSSSLVALHLAVSALRQGECDVALAGGVTVMSTPSVFVEFSRLRGMAVDGRCKSFSADADGAGWSEGCGVLVLKRLSAARVAGDRVLAVIRGSAVNQDGRSQGLTAPNGPSQQRVIQEALSRARLSPSDVDAVEAHGTGTALGDPVEAGALAAVFGPGRSVERPVWLGSAKSNIGHAQAAAGVIGVIKMVLALQHETLPLSLHAERPSEHIEWEGSGLRLLGEARSWPREESRLRRAGVSSFGLSGTNAHLVLEEAPAGEAAVTVAEQVAPGGVVPVVVSGRDAGVVRAQARRWAQWWRNHPEVSLDRVASTALWHRSWFDSRGAVLAATREEAIDRLEALAEGTDALGVIAPAETLGDIPLQDAGPGGVWVFPGQGSQWEGMGRVLFEQSPVFAETVRACEAALLPWTGWSVVEVLTGQRALSGVEEVQPALFAMSLGLAAWWESMGVTPQAVIGHSQGEVTAAVVAGVLTVEQGAKIVAARSRAVATCGGRGGMAVVERGLEWVTERLAGTGLSVAAVNTAASTVISGDSDALDIFLADVQAEGVFARRVQVDYASHSAHMDPLLPALAEELAGLRPAAGRIPMYSTVHGRLIHGSEMNAGYWCANLRRPVRFDLAGQAATADGHHTWTEISPHPVMAMVLDEIARQHGGTTVATAHRGQADTTDVLSSWTRAGLEHADQWPWERAVPRTPLEAALPTYAFDRERYWLPAPDTVPADP